MNGTDESEIARNYVDLHRICSEESGGKILERESFVFYSNPDSEWFTRIVLREDFDARKLGSELRELDESGFDSNILDFSNTRKHESVFRELGYDHCNEQLGMYLKGDPSVLERPKNVRCAAISDSENLKRWLRIVNVSFQSDDRENLYLRLLKRESISIYAAFSGGNMAATGMSFYNGNSVGLYSITTDPEQRGRKFASVLVSFMLERIRSVFSGIVILHATDMGKGIYERFGFQKSDTLRHWGRSASGLQ
ncbi:GNAT family N-acetyltransferase [Leptospira ellisii]|uniref:GNAT family N-acetyltransferase n=1 Tax=Leptospira ellisii TaxID=2023197 RepID=A0A2N0BE11_9LEPT|nr:GNAT family N-acetyltransferase [Leptospira ellisii]MDV6235582.1 GNAT family N-acetyltransferase [Leptospira ellisii]PJZ94778.1 GNAT family N-acetyltransferase [Leptospira ellisii]PKA05689.1 GNAT family N-acetyltransferase [Leptospira ellisii]